MDLCKIKIYSRPSLHTPLKKAGTNVWCRSH